MRQKTPPFLQGSRAVRNLCHSNTALRTITHILQSRILPAARPASSVQWPMASRSKLLEIIIPSF
jgi:hypothetical protein